MADPNDVLGELNKLMSSAMGAQMVQDIVHAYDAYATTAMQALIRNTGGGSVPQLAKLAWDFADAMMDERRKRGIGGMKPQESSEGIRCSRCGKPATRVIPTFDSEVAQPTALCEFC